MKTPETKLRHDLFSYVTALHCLAGQVTSDNKFYDYAKQHLEQPAKALVYINCKGRHIQEALHGITDRRSRTCCRL